MRVAIVLIYPCGKARKAPPEGALKEGRQTYEMARSGLFFEGALAPARWPHELEKPNPGFGRGGLVGLSEFGALGMGRVAHRPLHCESSGSGDLHFRRSMGCRLALCPASFPGARRKPLARFDGLPHPRFLRVGDGVVLRRAFRHRHARGSFCHDHLEGLV